MRALFSFLLCCSLLSALQAQEFGFVKEKEQTADEFQTFESLMIALKQADQVKKLDLYYKLDYSQLPQAIAELQELRILYLGHNNLEHLPPTFRQLQKLEELDLGQNPALSIQEIWPEVRELKNLRKLFIHRIQIDQLPQDFGQLQELEWLSLEGNHRIAVESLSALDQCKQLKTLNLAWCNLEALPSNLANFQQLEELYLNENQLTSIPEGLLALKQLKVLDLSDNELSQSDLEALKTALPQTKIYF
ncbi:leucine-rich repeat domain-containing protein [Saprospira sp. CCB-QB6]|uniref:leucine-rich repeat domain-containing protein n=1 Tax=Saprospira sp. CCB-QB6 TaxID=3023936 RepID=UPI00234A371E|nr:leucine-rich repeat domain-containing protein [Saprospira sp. CCB-QB6]WCL81558.1 leucine-rich repeat domain-containing protein [Saprospira sp. CCB-QB6]